MDWLTRLNQSPPSRLLALAPELRDLIYEFSLTSAQTLVTFKLDPYQQDTYAEATQPALTRISRQVRAETLPIYYACNTFVLHTGGSQAATAGAWLLCNERYLNQVRRFEVWVRYVRDSVQMSWGVIALALVKGAQGWKVDREWRWVTTVREPLGLGEDARTLLVILSRMLATELAGGLDARTLAAGLTELRVSYEKEKVA